MVTYLFMGNLERCGKKGCSSAKSSSFSCEWFFTFSLRDLRTNTASGSTNCLWPKRWFIFTWNGCSSWASPREWGRPGCSEGPAMAWGLDFSPLSTYPEMDTRRFCQVSAPLLNQLMDPRQFPRLCRNYRTTTVWEERWYHHYDHD